MALTDTAIKRAKRQEKAKRLYDTLGLYLEVSPAGGKWWRFKYRFDRKEKLLSLGTYPEVSLADARERRDAARKQVAAGVDPSSARKAEKTARAAALTNNFEAVARKWLEHRQGSKWSEKTHDMVEASLVNHVFPKLGRTPIADLKPADIRDVVKAVEVAGASETAGRIFQRIRAVFRYAITHELLTVDPTYSLRPSEFLKGHKVRHRAALSQADAPGFLRKLAVYDGDPSTKNALLLLVLTAVRPGELRGALWSEFDTERALWRIGAERMKMKTEHLVPLSTQALAVLAEMKKLSTGDALVFPSPFYPGKPLSENTLNSALARMGYKGAATAHGMRTLFSTIANEAGFAPDVIEKQLAHEERDEVRAAYNRALYLAERTKLMQWYADRLDKLRDGAEVIPFMAA